MFNWSPDAELLKRLLNSDQENFTPYIWDPFSPETEAYLQSLEQSWPEDIVADYAAIVPSFQKALNLVPEQLVSESQEASLPNFPGIPQPVLQHILAKAKATSLEVLALPEQLLECVQELFPRWSIEDLQVVARPYAYAFRNSAQGSPTTPPPEAIEWDQLSDLEQIRLCFQVSKAILKDITDSNVF
ncbi:MAG: hypothetical protein ACO3EZ_18810 [Prochlorotrichaceae cyanobacterium]